MSGYAISIDEVSATCRRLLAEAQGAGDLVANVRLSAVGAADFGSAARDDVGSRYVAAVHGPLAGALHDLAEVGARVAESLLTTFEAYDRADEDAQRVFRTGGWR